MPSNTDPKTILLAGSPIAHEKQSASGSAITPGQLVEVTTADELQEHSTAGGNAQAAFASSEDYAGGSIDDDYAVGDTVRYYVGKPGDQFYAFLATGNNASIGTYLESDGNGDLQVHTPQAVDEGGTATYSINTEAVVCKAVEALNNTSGSPSRIKVEIV